MVFSIIGSPTPTPAPDPTASLLGYAWGGFGLTQTGIAMTTGANSSPVNGTKGTPCLLAAATARPLDALVLTFQTSLTARPLVFDLLVNDLVVVSNFFVFPQNGQPMSATLYLSIPAGASIKLAGLSIVGNVPYVIGAIGGYSVAGTPRTFGTVIQLGALTANIMTCGAAGVDLKGAAWVLVATIPAAGAKGFYPFVGNNNLATSRTPGSFNLEFGTGPDAVSVVPFLTGLLAQNIASAANCQKEGPILVDIPGGTNLYVRVNGGSVAMEQTADRINVVVMALQP